MLLAKISHAGGVHAEAPKQYSTLKDTLFLSVRIAVMTWPCHNKALWSTAALTPLPC